MNSEPDSAPPKAQPIRYKEPPVSFELLHRILEMSGRTGPHHVQILVPAPNPPSRIGMEFRIIPVHPAAQQVARPPAEHQAPVEEWVVEPPPKARQPTRWPPNVNGQEPTAKAQGMAHIPWDQMIRMPLPPPPNDSTTTSTTTPLSSSAQRTTTSASSWELTTDHEGQEHNREIQVLVKTLEGKTVTVDITPGTDIAVIRRKISDKTSIPENMILLTAGGKLLEDGKVAADYGLQAGFTLNMVARLKGGMQGDWVFSPQWSTTSPVLSPLPLS